MPTSIEEAANTLSDWKDYETTEAEARELKLFAKKMAREAAEAKLRRDSNHEELLFEWARVLWDRAQTKKNNNERPMKNSTEAFYGLAEMEEYLEQMFRQHKVEIEE